jgi:hypothetical protein
MRVFLDDIRPAPSGFVLVKKPEEAIRLLQTGQVTHLSLDHDLGDIPGTGNDVLLWIEKEVFLNGFAPPSITVHSSNPSARVKMLAGIEKINEMVARKG